MIEDLKHAAAAERPAGPDGLDGLDETTIVVRAQDGDLAAFESLIDRYQRPLFRLAVRILRDRELAEDVLQDSLIAAWRKLPTLDQPGAVRTWLYRLLTFRCLDALRRRRDADPLDEERDSEDRGQGRDPAEVVEHREHWRQLHQAVGELPAQSRVCWILKEIDGLSYGEIAEVINQPVSTVRGRIARARQQLAERMASWR
ncbi:RNA polymerase sigma factor [Microlunatus parietis]|uniref:RNA polymerase sigma-70 factor (ECF subfamily) n=1 Tax=Microlunatus parietis TaxID=682979 RepID=A0A7Y9I7W3_9ACTN|nr:sigma-70 family RNA polymerase sigma factor [Microlunatus parietis]NYE71934.1 RNA polymerase sigma-70 factor (ECF subfamily) [Microlunatus parietis]